MKKITKLFLLSVTLLAVGFFLQSCNDDTAIIEKQNVQFTLIQAMADSRTVNNLDIPEGARAKISISASNGSPVLVNHDVSVFKDGDVYVTEPVVLSQGAYVVTDFMIVDDANDLFVAPKKGAELATSENDALPHNFSVNATAGRTVEMLVMNVGDEDLRKFGYASSKGKSNDVTIEVYDNINGSTSMTSATAELYQNGKLLKVISLSAAANTITLNGDRKVPYTLTVYTNHSAAIKTFVLHELKKEVKNNPLRMMLEPALVFTVESYVDAGNEYEDYFEFRMEGSGSVNINWGNGTQSTRDLPFLDSYEYIMGNYTAFVTGDIDQITDFAGFSYNTIISTITGLTNLTSLKTYNPSWGAVPIKVDLSNCKALETISIAKYGAPYEPCDLRTEFKLPSEHNITTFILDAPSFDSNREYISEEELDVMVNNIYNNTVARGVNNGKFYVNPVVMPSAEAQQKLEILENDYAWAVGFNDEIYEAYGAHASGRSASEEESRREEWLRMRFPNAQQIIDRAEVAHQ